MKLLAKISNGDYLLRRSARLQQTIHGGSGNDWERKALIEQVYVAFLMDTPFYQNIVKYAHISNILNDCADTT